MRFRIKKKHIISQQKMKHSSFKQQFFDSKGDRQQISPTLKSDTRAISMREQQEFRWKIYSRHE